jgi:hypothetical protein
MSVTRIPTSDSIPEDYLAPEADAVRPACAQLTGRATLVHAASGERHTWVWNTQEVAYLLALIECPVSGLSFPRPFVKAGADLERHLDGLLLGA